MLTGTENEKALDVSQLRKNSGVITYDDGYGNTGSCESSVTFIDGDKGILRYRGYDIAELAEKANFLEVCLLLLNGELPTSAQLSNFQEKVSAFQNLPSEVLKAVESLPTNIHPMASLATGLQALGGACSHLCTNDRQKIWRILMMQQHLLSQLCPPSLLPAIEKQWVNHLRTPINPIITVKTFCQ